MQLCRLHDIHMRYGRETVLNGVDLALERGSIIGLVGENGSGKSTLLKILSGILRPDSGILQTLDGRPRLGYMPENCQWYPYLSGAQVLRYFARYTGAGPAQQDEVLARVGLWEARDKKVRAYSKGMRQKLGLAQAISGNPALLVLDEPTNGLDPRGIIDFYDILQERVAAGATVILSSHLLTELEGRITHVAFLHGGRIVAADRCHRLIAEHRLPYRINLQSRPLDDTTLRTLQNGPWEVSLRQDEMEFRLQKPDLPTFFHRLATLDIRPDDLQVRSPMLDDLYLHLMAQQIPVTANGHSAKHPPHPIDQCKETPHA